MTMRVLTYNIHKCIGGLDRRYRPERIVDVIAAHEADVVLLQEVDDGCARSQQHRQVDWLGDRLGLPHRAWAANVNVGGGGTYGNAILSRWPLLGWANLDLTVGKRKRRSALYARVDVPGPGVVPVFNLHLGLAQAERETQVAMLMGAGELATLRSDAAAVLGGDLNDVYGSLAAHLAPGGFSRPDGQVPRTFPAWAPMRSLDGLYVRGRATLSTLTRSNIDLAKRASDHRPLWADVTLA